MSTAPQHTAATFIRLAPNQAAIMPAKRATAPEIGLSVASIMAGKVITASVTYGT